MLLCYLIEYYLIIIVIIYYYYFPRGYILTQKSRNFHRLLQSSCTTMAFKLASIKLIISTNFYSIFPFPWYIIIMVFQTSSANHFEQESKGRVWAAASLCGNRHGIKNVYAMMVFIDNTLFSLVCTGRVWSNERSGTVSSFSSFFCFILWLEVNYF